MSPLVAPCGNLVASALIDNSRLECTVVGYTRRFRASRYTCRPGNPVKVAKERFHGETTNHLDGFARSKMLLVWQDTRAAKVNRVLIKPWKSDEEYVSLRVSMRPSTSEEVEKFGHDRMPGIVASLGWTDRISLPFGWRLDCRFVASCSAAEISALKKNRAGYASGS